jgi:hypothetical protein
LTSSKMVYGQKATSEIHQPNGRKRTQEERECKKLTDPPSADMERENRKGQHRL